MTDPAPLSPKDLEQWRQVEETVRPVLFQADADEGMEVYITGRMKEHVTNLNRDLKGTVSLSWPAHVSAGERQAITDAYGRYIGKLVSNGQSMLSQALSELLRLEVELYLLRRSQGSGPLTP